VNNDRDDLRIWKFPLRLEDVQELEIPRHNEILTCQVQNGGICLWAIVDPKQRTEKRTVRIVGTGRPMPDGCTYVSTVQMGAFVWHIFLEAF